MPTAITSRPVLLIVSLSIALGAAAISAPTSNAAQPPEPTVALVPSGSGLGYLIVTDGGIVFPYGDAGYFGGLEEFAPLAEPIVGGAMTPSGLGYWLWASDGGVFAFGDAGFFGSMGAVALTQPIVGGAPTVTGLGYWLWAADGGVFAFGDAGFFGSMGAVALTQPVVGGSPTRGGHGYWLWAADGGVFAFGDAGFFGSLGAISLDQPVIAGGPTASGSGYVFIASDGGSFAFGDAAFPGSSAERNVDFVAGAVTPDGLGLWLLTVDGYLEVLGSAPRLGSPQAGPAPSPPPPLDEVGVEIVTFAGGLVQPIDIVSRPGDASSVYVAERRGRVLRIDISDSSIRSEVLDISHLTTPTGERGLLGLVFSDDGSTLYLNHTNSSKNVRIVEYQMDGNIADPASRRELLGIDQPYGNHNGGDITLGPDGYLYISSGDGGSGGDPENNGQDLGSLLGTILRIDPAPSEGSQYTIPADNPFVGVAGAEPEIWAFGLRNPWRIAFDRATGVLWIADVGQGSYEEIDVIPAGQGGLNFGWRIKEGNHPFEGADDPGGLTDPIFEYDHDSGCSVTGGVVVADPRLQDLLGVYLFTDFCDADLRALRVDGLTVTNSASIAQLPFGPVTFGEGPDNEIYVGAFDGTISRIDPVG